MLFESRLRNNRSVLSRSGPLLLACLLAACAASNEATEATVESILELHAQERFTESVVLLDSMLRDNPGDEELCRLFGIALLQVGMPSIAIWPLSRAAESPDATPRIGLLLARAHYAGGHAEDAIAAADRVLELKPDMVEALQLRIRAKESLKQYEEALADTELIRDINPEHGPALVSQVQMLLLLEREDEAAAAIEEMREIAEAAEGPANWIGKMCAIDATFTYERGHDEYLDRTREIWERCVEDYPAQNNVVSGAIDFYDAQGEHERGTEILRGAIEAAPETFDFQTRLGLRLAGMGLYEESERVLRTAAESSGSKAIWSVLINHYDNRDQLDKALTAMKQMLSVAEEHTKIEQLQYADMLIRAGEFETASETIRNIPEPAHKALLEGRLLLATGKPKKALARLDEGIRLWPGNSVTRQLAADAAEQQGAVDRAMAEYKEAVRSDTGNFEALERWVSYLKASGAYDSIGQVVGRYLGVQPDDPRAHRFMIDVEQRRGRLRVAAEGIEKLGRLPGHLPEAIAMGASLRARSNPREALVYIERYPLDLTAPANNEVLAALVEVLEKLDRQDDALARANAALAAHPDNGAFHEIHAAALAAAGRPLDEVRAALTRAVELAPRRASALIELARLHGEAGEIDEALALYTRAARAAPQGTDARWAAIELMIAEGRDEGIDARAGSLLKAHPYHPHAARLLAERVMARGGDLDVARDFARRAVRFQGGAGAWLILGIIELERGDSETAVGVLRNAVRAAPKSPTNHYHFGRALAASGDAEGARDAFEKALADDGFPEAEAEVARAELARLNL